MAADGAKRMISCPRCRRLLDARWFRSVRVEACASCKGILADRSTLDSLGVDTARLWDAEPGRQRARKIDCPVCRSYLATIAVGGLELDRCDRDSLIWFDGAELMKLVPAEETKSNRVSGVSQFLEGLASLLEAFA